MRAGHCSTYLAASSGMRCGSPARVQDEWSGYESRQLLHHVRVAVTAHSCPCAAYMYEWPLWLSHACTCAAYKCPPRLTLGADRGAVQCDAVRHGIMRCNMADDTERAMSRDGGRTDDGVSWPTRGFPRAPMAIWLPPHPTLSHTLIEHNTQAACLERRGGGRQAVRLTCMWAW